jgi:hypothetical protein
MYQLELVELEAHSVEHVHVLSFLCSVITDIHPIPGQWCSLPFVSAVISFLSQPSQLLVHLCTHVHGQRSETSRYCSVQANNLCADEIHRGRVHL